MLLCLEDGVWRLRTLTSQGVSFPPSVGDSFHTKSALALWPQKRNLTSFTSDKRLHDSYVVIGRYMFIEEGSIINQSFG